ncbi:MAG: hypothetical protein V1926_00920 [Candidatus Peregrinibacteria bacterium]
MVTMDQILFGLEIAVAVMLIVLLYHALFIVVDLRKIMRRIEDITGHVEDVIMKPLNMADLILQWIIERIDSDRKNKKEKKKHGGSEVLK